MSLSIESREALVVFIGAQYDEDEATAKANIGNNGLADTEDGGPGYPDYQTYSGDDIDAACAYLNRFRPLRVLREVGAMARCSECRL